MPAGPGRAPVAAHCPPGRGLRPACMLRSRRPRPCPRRPGPECRLRAGSGRGGAARQSAPRRSMQSHVAAAAAEATAAAGKAARSLPDAQPLHQFVARAAPLRRGAGRAGPAAGGGGGEGGCGTQWPQPDPPRCSDCLAPTGRRNPAPGRQAARHLSYAGGGGRASTYTHAAAPLTRTIRHGRTRQSNDGGEGVGTRAIVRCLSPATGRQGQARCSPAWAGERRARQRPRPRPSAPGLPWRRPCGRPCAASCGHPPRPCGQRAARQP